MECQCERPVLPERLFIFDFDPVLVFVFVSCVARLTFVAASGRDGSMSARMLGMERGICTICCVDYWVPVHSADSAHTSDVSFTCYGASDLPGGLV